MSEDDVRVVVVDDFIDAAEALAETLMMSGYKVWIATDGPGALALIETHQPHCVLLDIGMPGMDGYELLKEIRALAHSADLKLAAIALTAFARSEDRTRALRAGFLLHLAKPVEPSELIATVASVSGRTDTR